MKLIVTKSRTWGGSVVFRAEDLEQIADTASALDPVDYAEYDQHPDSVDLDAMLRVAVEEIDTETATAKQVCDLRTAADFAPPDEDIEAAIVAAEARIAADITD